MKTTIPMNKKQVQEDLESLLSKFRHVHKYYNLQDKEIIREKFEVIINDLKEYTLTIKL